METSHIKEKIKIAREAVKDEEEPYKTEAFKIILSSLIGEVTSTMKKKGKSKSNSKSKHSKRKKTLSRPVILEQKNELSELAQKCSISTESLSEIITIKNNIIQIIKRPKIQEKQKHVLFSLCIITAYKILYEIEWLSSVILRKALDESRVGDLGHSSEAMIETPLIVNRGTKKAKEYKITGKGVDTAIEIIKKLSKDEPIAES